MPRPLFLLGMMGAGKSTVGRRVASALSAPFVDLDVRIERMFGTSISGLFATGEAYFRACERTALRSLVDEPGFADSTVVVATGGGVVVQPANLRDMARVGTTVYLKVPVPILAQRLRRASELGQRPLLEAGDLDARLHQLLEARTAAYESADITIDASAPIEDITAEILALT